MESASLRRHQCLEGAELLCSVISAGRVRCPVRRSVLLCSAINQWRVPLPALTIFRSLPGHLHCAISSTCLSRSFAERSLPLARARRGGRGAERLGEPAARSGARAVDLLLWRSRSRRAAARRSSRWLGSNAPRVAVRLPGAPESPSALGITMSRGHTPDHESHCHCEEAAGRRSSLPRHGEIASLPGPPPAARAPRNDTEFGGTFRPMTECANRRTLATRSGAALRRAARGVLLLPPSLRAAQRRGAAASGPDARRASRSATTRTCCTRGARPAKRNDADGPLPAALRGKKRVIQIGEGQAARRAARALTASPGGAQRRAGSR
jgi:hypothetical protein